MAFWDIIYKKPSELFNPTEARESYTFWYTVYAFLFLLFYIFSAPFSDNRELKRQWSAYVYLSTALYMWLSAAVALHFPTLNPDVGPISMFSPFMVFSVVTLLLAEATVKLADRYFVFHVGFKQNSIEVFQNSMIVSIICCVVYSHCGDQSSASYENGPLQFATDPNPFNVCRALFSGHTNKHDLPTVIVLWSTAMSMIVLNFAFERLTAYRGVFVEYQDLTNKIPPITPRHSHLRPQRTHLHLKIPQSEPNAEGEITNHNLNHTNNSSFSRSPSPNDSLFLPYIETVSPELRNELLQPKMLPMVPWYAIVTSYTAVDLLIHLKLFVGRFDMRTLQASLPNSFHYPLSILPSSSSSMESTSTLSDYAHNQIPDLPKHVHPHHLDTPFYYDHLSSDNELWFDWAADTGDGWNSTYNVARALAQPSLTVNVKRRGTRSMGTFLLPRGKLLILGGDLAYPSPTTFNYESRFFRPFQCALPPPPNYDSRSISIQKPSISGGLEGLRTYEGPQCFAIPGNHDWHDGLHSFLRYICGRDFLGGWFLPQEKSWFALKFPYNWWLFAMDNALTEDINVEQYQYFARIAASLKKEDKVILAYHEPDWILNPHEGAHYGANIHHLQTLLAGKVVLKIAGDLHNYTRHIPYSIFTKALKSKNKLPNSTTDSKPMGEHEGDSDPFRWWSPISWVRALIPSPYEDKNHICLEDILEGDAPLSINRAESMPNLSHLNTSTSHSDLSTPFGSSNTLDSKGNLPTSTRKITPLAHRPYTLISSPPPSPSMSGHKPPIELSTRFAPGSLLEPLSLKRSQTEIRMPTLLSEIKEDQYSGLKPHPAAAQHASEVLEWSTEHVCAWLKSYGFSEYVNAFRANQVDGLLLTELDHQDLQEDLGIHSRLTRKRLLICIKELLQSSDGVEDQMMKDSNMVTTLNDANNSSLLSTNYVGTKKKGKRKHKKIKSIGASESWNIPLDPTPNDSPPMFGEPSGSPSSYSARTDHTIRPPILLVSGGGGAFMHPTHVPGPGPLDVRGTEYVRTCSYPSLSTSRRYALLNIFGFRKRNWRFDIVGGVAYFLLIYSMLPLCNLTGFIHAVDQDSWLELFLVYVRTLVRLHIRMFSESYVSLAMFLVLFSSTLAFTHVNWPLWKRFSLAIAHSLSHSCAAFSVCIFVEVLMELGLKYNLLGQPPLSISSLSDSAPSFFKPFAIALARFDYITNGYTSSFVSILTKVFDIPDTMAHFRKMMCDPCNARVLFAPGTVPLSGACDSLVVLTRADIILYYFTHGLYLWVLCTSTVSFIFGSYLYLASTFCGIHMTESFSSLRVEGYKNFVRFHITQQGDLEIFVLGMDRSAHKWVQDPNWSGNTYSSPSYLWSKPSVWKPEAGEPDKIRLVDYIVIRRDGSYSLNVVSK